MKILLSVIMPVFNVEQYLEIAVKSVLEQSIIDLELILVDDGSDDSSGVICDSYAKKDHRVVVLHQQNCGVSAARNRALRIARGKYIGFVDSDDWIEKDMYHHLLLMMEQEKADVAVGGVCLKNGNVDLGNTCVFSSKEAISCMLKNTPFGGFLCDKLYKKDLFYGLELNENISMCEDVLLNVDLFFKSKRVVYSPVNQYHYRIRNDSVSNGKFSLKLYNGTDAMEFLYNQMKGLRNGLDGVAFSAWINMNLYCALRLLESGDKQNKRYFYKIRENFKSNLKSICMNFHLPLRKKCACFFLSFLSFHICLVSFNKVWRKSHNE